MQRVVVYVSSSACLKARSYGTSRYPSLAGNIARRIKEGEDLAFAWVTPRSLACGLEGGILARLLSIPGINLQGARMYAPSDAMIDDYIEVHKAVNRPQPFRPFVEYLESLKSANNADRGYPNHLMMLLFTGNKPLDPIMNAIGEELPDPRRPNVGKTIRGAYGHHRRDAQGKISEFEPALVGAQHSEACHKYLEVFSKYADTDGGVLISPDQWNEVGMVMIKPDMLERPSSKPGHIMDLFSSTGLRLVGSRMLSMSVKEATDFYGFLQPIFAKKLAPKVDQILRQRLDGAFEFQVSDHEYEIMTALLKQKNATSEVASIIHYMTGVYPRHDLTEAERSKRGTARCLALLYHGPNAIQTIRNKLGSTDPGQAEVGTIRSDYGMDVMRNSAHASDSLEALHRERRIVGLNFTREERAARCKQPDFHPCALKTIIDQWLEVEKEQMDGH